ncbi:hypothetical protein ACVI1I_002713 [Bradyrhizobium sp. USDA 4459]
MSPPAAVFEIAPAKVLHGAVRLQGFTSSPTPETQVRVVCAYDEIVETNQKATSATVAKNTFFRYSLHLRPKSYIRVSINYAGIDW